MLFIAGLYGNDDLHNGILEVLTSGRKVDNLISTIRNQTLILETTLKNNIRPQLMELADAFDKPVNNQTALSNLFISLNIVQGNVTLATNAAGDIRRPLMGLLMTDFLSVSFFFIVFSRWTPMNCNCLFHLFSESRSMGAYPLARNRCNSCTPSCLMCSPTCRRSPSFSVCSHSF